MLLGNTEQGLLWCALLPTPLYQALLDRDTRVPNFQTSSSTSWLRPSGDVTSENITKSASASASRVPLTPCIPSMAAGVAVTAPSARGIDAPVHCRKLLTHSSRVIELRPLVSANALRPSTPASQASRNCTHLPAIVFEFSSSSLDPFFTMLHTWSPFVHG
jgi:hypothetical protein